MSNMSYNTYDFLPGAEIGTSELRGMSASGRLRQLLADHPVVRVARYHSETAAWLIEPKVWEEVLAGNEQARELRRTLTLLIGAIAAGVKIPSETLSRLGIEGGDASWQAINEFQARYEVEPMVDEDGHPLQPIALHTGSEAELDEELVTLVD